MSRPGTPKPGTGTKRIRDPVADEQRCHDDGRGFAGANKGTYPGRMPPGSRLRCVAELLEWAHAGGRRKRENRAVVHCQTDGEDNGRAAKSVEQQLAPRIAPAEPGFEGEDQRDSDDEEEEREDEIGRRPAIPFGMFQWPVRMIVSGIIDQDHGGDGDATEEIERGEASGGGGHRRGCHLSFLSRKNGGRGGQIASRLQDGVN